jgi:hypothetical protein
LYRIKYYKVPLYSYLPLHAICCSKYRIHWCCLSEYFFSWSVLDIRIYFFNLLLIFNLSHCLPVISLSSDDTRTAQKWACFCIGIRLLSIPSRRKAKVLCGRWN